MRLTNTATGMPFEAFHRGAIQIPFVVNHHLLKGERDAVQNRKPSTELKFSIKYFDDRDRRSVMRFLGAVEEMVSKKKVREVVEAGAVSKLKMLLLENDLKMVFDTECVIVQAVGKDPKGLFTGQLLDGDGLDILLNMMMLDERREGDRAGRAAREHYAKMIRGNALYIIAYAISNGFVQEIMDPAMVDLLLGRTEDEDPIARGNALFCFKMTVDTDPSFSLDLDSVFVRAVEMLEDQDQGVQEEAVKLVLSFLSEDIVPLEYASEIVDVIERLSKSEIYEITKASEEILYRLKERGLMEET